MEFYFSALLLGLALCSLGFGIYISLRIFSIPDITTDGSYTLGAAVTAALLLRGIPIPVILLITILCGAFAGIATGIIHTRMRLNALLSGILVMTSLYSINLQIMGRSNIPLINTKHIEGAFGFLQDNNLQWLGVLLLFIGLIWVLLSWLLKTDFGVAMRATGTNEVMVRSMGVNTLSMKVTGLAIANALTAVSGFLVCQFQQFSDINMGIGIVIFGLGSVMMGESLLSAFKIQSIGIRLLAVVAGCIAFRLIIAVALEVGINPNWLKAITALIVLLVAGIPQLKRSAQ